MKAIILSAGKGTRVKGINDKIPKVLLPILNKPMLNWNIDLLKRYGITKIAINTHHLSEKIKSYLGDGSKFGVNIKYSYELELLGTSGALNNFKKFFDDVFVVIYGDVISNINLEKLVKFHKKHGGTATLVVHESSHPKDSDIVQMDKNNKVINFVHKPRNRDFGTLGNAALYVVDPIIFKYLPEGKSDFIQDIFQKMIKNGEQIYGYKTEEFIKDAGTPERLTQVQQDLKKEKEFNNNNDNL